MPTIAIYGRRRLRAAILSRRQRLERFCLCLGAFAGNIALAHGANALVLAGGLGLRLREHLPASGFAERLVAKGEYRSILEQLPVKLIAHAEPGLYGAAAAAFAERFVGLRLNK